MILPSSLKLRIYPIWFRLGKSSFLVVILPSLCISKMSKKRINWYNVHEKRSVTKVLTFHCFVWLVLDLVHYSAYRHFSRGMEPLSSLSPVVGDLPGVPQVARPFY